MKKKEKFERKRAGGNAEWGMRNAEWRRRPVSPVRTPRSPLRTSHSGVLEHFLNGGRAFVNVAQSVLAKPDHAQFNGFLTNDQRRRLLGDEFANRIADIQQFIQA